MLPPMTSLEAAMATSHGPSIETSSNEENNSVPILELNDDSPRWAIKMAICTNDEPDVEL